MTEELREKASLTEKIYCGDCLFWALKRDKEGIVTGEHICPKWGDQYRAEFQEACAFCITKEAQLDKVLSTITEEIEKLENPYTPYDYHRPYSYMDEDEEDRIETAKWGAYREAKQDILNKLQEVK